MMSASCIPVVPPVRLRMARSHSCGRRADTRGPEGLRRALTDTRESVFSGQGSLIIRDLEWYLF